MGSQSTILSSTQGSIPWNSLQSRGGGLPLPRAFHNRVQEFEIESSSRCSMDFDIRSCSSNRLSEISDMLRYRLPEIQSSFISIKIEPISRIRDSRPGNAPKVFVLRLISALIRSTIFVVRILFQCSFGKLR